MAKREREYTERQRDRCERNRNRLGGVPIPGTQTENKIFSIIYLSYKFRKFKIKIPFYLRK